MKAKQPKNHSWLKRKIQRKANRLKKLIKYNIYHGKKNVFEETQELIKYIETNYQEGVDYKHNTWDEIHKEGVGNTSILSPRLKKYCREKFGFPSGVDDYLNYWKDNAEGGSAVYYQTKQTINKTGRGDVLWWCKEKLSISELEKGAKKASEMCSVCQKVVFRKEGLMELWNGEVKDIGYSKVWKPSVLNYFHPHCAKRYFSNKEPVSEMKARHQKVKEILLCNLDKICLDPENYLANIKYLKTDGAEEEYKKAMNSAYGTEWKERYMKLVIEGEEIDLEDFDNSDGYFEVKRELVKKIKSEIKQNPSEWKIEPGKNYNYDDQSRNQLVKHLPSGRRYWKVGISEMRGKSEWKVEGKQDWAEIEALINGSKLPIDNNKKNNIELEKLKKIFQSHNIKKVIFKNGQLLIEYDHKVNSVEKAVNDSEKQALEKFCREHKQQEITKESLNLGSNNNSTSPKPSQWENKYLWLAGGILIGISVLVIFRFIGKKRKVKKI